MPLKHLHLELLSKASSEYAEQQGRLHGYVVTDLYKIHYADVESRKSSGCGVWSEPIYYHGTWSCGCTDTPRAQDGTSGPILIPTDNWCKSERCATRGILREGHRLEHVTCDIRGHFFSDQLEVAVRFGLQKVQYMQSAGYSSYRGLPPLFLCKARNVQQRSSSPSLKYVNSDMGCCISSTNIPMVSWCLINKDIIPCYLAIIHSLPRMSLD